jgi:hypothetical protein
MTTLSQRIRKIPSLNVECRSDKVPWSEKFSRLNSRKYLGIFLNVKSVHV